MHLRPFCVRQDKDSSCYWREQPSGLFAIESIADDPAKPVARNFQNVDLRCTARSRISKTSVRTYRQTCHKFPRVVLSGPCVGKLLANSALEATRPWPCWQGHITCGIMCMWKTLYVRLLLAGPCEALPEFNERLGSERHFRGSVCYSCCNVRTSAKRVVLNYVTMILVKKG